jgi:hypothetical protein
LASSFAGRVEPLFAPALLDLPEGAFVAPRRAAVALDFLVLPFLPEPVFAAVAFFARAVFLPALWFLAPPFFLVAVDLAARDRAALVFFAAADFLAELFGFDLAVEVFDLEALRLRAGFFAGLMGAGR